MGWIVLTSRESKEQFGLILDVLDPRGPPRRDLGLNPLTLVVDIQQEVDESVRVVHPRQAEDDGGVVVR